MVEDKVPAHVCIIPDGNRRWARQEGISPLKAHEKATEPENIKVVFEEARKLGVKYISLWGFSTENWKRSAAEKKILFRLIAKTLDSLRDYANENKIRFRHIGRKDRLPEKVVEKLEEFEKETESYGAMNIQICLDYGGRDELVRAVNKIAQTAGQLGDIKEKTFSNYLDTSGIPDVDLIIRTGGEHRLSGFMPYQSTYAELYFTDIYFPDFGPAEFRKAVEEFSERVRRFGGD